MCHYDMCSGYQPSESKVAVHIHLMLTMEVENAGVQANLLELVMLLGFRLFDTVGKWILQYGREGRHHQVSTHVVM